MDRFIGQPFMRAVRVLSGLKSNMDRFIVRNNGSIWRNMECLKSNMDRFIVKRISGKLKPGIEFKIQYG